MKIIPHQNAASSVISVTNTATKVFDLIDTAGSLSDSRTYFLSPNNGGPANGISIRPEEDVYYKRGEEEGICLRSPAFKSKLTYITT